MTLKERWDETERQYARAWRAYFKKHPEAKAKLDRDLKRVRRFQARLAAASKAN